MSPENPPGEDARKPYEKPQISQVSLRPDEAVLGNCKIMSVAGPASSDCLNLSCNSPGS